MSIQELEQRIEAIEARNKRVEADKAWETSLTRKAAILVITYFVAALVLTALQNPAPLLNASLPTAGFFLSTLTFSFIKQHWLRRFYPKDSRTN